MKNYYVYILSNTSNQVLYIGVTSHLIRRVFEHKNHVVDGFTQKYNVTKLVYFEQGSDVEAAIAREKQIKRWQRDKKNHLINQFNPDWNDLYPDLVESGGGV